MNERLGSIAGTDNKVCTRIFYTNLYLLLTECPVNTTLSEWAIRYVRDLSPRGHSILHKLRAQSPEYLQAHSNPLMPISAGVLYLRFVLSLSNTAISLIHSTTV